MIHITGDTHANFSRLEEDSHDYRQVNSQFTLLYENIVPLEFNSIFE